MAKEVLKRELIEWVVKLDDAETLDFLKIIKDSKSSKRNWWRNGTVEEAVDGRGNGFEEEMAIANEALTKSIGSEVL